MSDTSDINKKVYSTDKKYPHYPALIVVYYSLQNRRIIRKYRKTENTQNNKIIYLNYNTSRLQKYNLSQVAPKTYTTIIL